MPDNQVQSTSSVTLKATPVQSEGTITVRRIEIPREIKIAIGERIDAERTAQSNR
jgi:hypothetical protein